MTAQVKKVQMGVFLVLAAKTEVHVYMDVHQEAPQGSRIGYLQVTLAGDDQYFLQASPFLALISVFGIPIASLLAVGFRQH